MSLSSRALFAPRAPGLILPPSVPTLAFPQLQAKLSAGQRAVWALIGDSLLAGWGSNGVAGTGSGAGTGGNYLRSKAWPQQMAALLNAAGIPTRADAYFASIPGSGSGNTAADVAAANPNVSFGSGWQVSSLTSLGGCTTNGLSSATGSWVFQPDYPTDGFDIIVTGASGLGTITASDANGPLTNGAIVETTLSGVVIGSTACRRVTVTRSTSSMLPINLTRTSGGQVFFVGVIPYDTTSPRLELLNMGWPTSRAYGVDATTPHWNAWTNPTSAYSAHYALAALNADAWTIELGANDSNGGIAASDYQTGLTNIASKVKGLGGDVALIKTNKSNTGSGGLNISAAYLSAIDSVQASLGLLPTIDFNSLPLVAADFFDQIHLTQQGYGKKAAAAKQYLIGS